MVIASLKKNFCGLRNASRFCECALSTFFFIILKQSMKKFAVVGFEIATFNSKHTMNVFVSLKPTKSRTNFRKSQTNPKIFHYNNFNLLGVESTPQVLIGLI